MSSDTDAGTCAVANQACEADSDCCADLLCDPALGVCATPVTCGVVDEACVFDEDCCADLVCDPSLGTCADESGGG